MEWHVICFWSSETPTDVTVRCDHQWWAHKWLADGSRVGDDCQSLRPKGLVYFFECSLCSLHNTRVVSHTIPRWLITCWMCMYVLCIMYYVYCICICLRLCICICTCTCICSLVVLLHTDTVFIYTFTSFRFMTSPTRNQPSTGYLPCIYCH